MVQLASQRTFFSSSRKASMSSAMTCLYTNKARLDQRTTAFGLAGASITLLQAGGRSASVSGLGGTFGGGPGLGCRTESLNQKASSLAAQPSPPGTGGCLRQFGESAGHFSRTWMWSSWPYQGRTLAIQEKCCLPSMRHNSFLIAALTSTRSTLGCWAAVLMNCACCGVQTFGLMVNLSAATTLMAEMSSRSFLLSSWSGIGMNQMSTSSPI